VPDSRRTRRHHRVRLTAAVTGRLSALAAVRNRRASCCVSRS
jgi:hypothetical protein